MLATDTQKNTVYAMARKLGGIEPEAFALELAAHYTGSQQAISRARIAIQEYPWVPVSGTGHSFARSGQYTRTVTVIDDAELGRSVVGGIGDLTILNTTGSQFWGFPRDEYTTLEDAVILMIILIAVGRTLTTAKVNGRSVLAETYQTGIGFINFPVYTFSGDTGYGASCSANAACQRTWPSVLTSGSPGVQGVPASGIGEVGIGGGLTQVTWNGQPLYLFSHEELIPTSNGSGSPAGNGNGVKAFGGTFSLVANP